MSKKKDLKIIVPIGIPGSGKSTLAKKMVEEEKRKDAQTRIISRDSIRECLFGKDYKFSKHKEAEVSLAKRDQIFRAARDPYCQTIIIDETHCSDRMRASTFDVCGELIDQIGFDPLIVHLVVEDSFNVDLCHKRNVERERSVPYEVIERMFQNFFKFVQENESVRREYPWVPQSVIFPKNAPKCFIIDIDGTLADHKGIRSPFDWKEVGKDRPRTDVINMVNMIPADHLRIIFSGRDESCRSETEEWLNKHGVWFDQLHMRPEGDQRKDYIIKMELFQKHVNDKYRCVGVIDDRMQVVRYWRALGLTVFQVDLGMF